jgi:hypothetical protein
MEENPTRPKALQDLMTLVEICRSKGFGVGLIEVALRRALPDGAPSGVTVLAGSDAEMISEAINNRLVLVGIAHGFYGGGEQLPADRSMLLEHGHPYAYFHFFKSSYRQLEVRQLGTEFSAIRGLDLLDDERAARNLFGRLVDRGESGQSDSQSTTSDGATQERSEEDAERERRRLEQARHKTFFEGFGRTDLDDDQDELTIDFLDHRAILEQADVIWDWSPGDGVGSGGPMSREYRDVVIRWTDGSYFYLLIGDGYHELTPLGSYPRPSDAVEAGKLHSLYTDEERDNLDEG